MATGFVDVSLLGDEALQKAFKDMPFTMQKKIMRPATRKAAKEILKEAKVQVPFDKDRKRPGKHLRQTLRVRAIKRSRVKIGAEVQTGTRSELGISSDDKYYYPAAVELGARGLSVQSYLRLALFLRKASTFGILKEQLRAGLAKFEAQQQLEADVNSRIVSQFGDL